MLTHTSPERDAGTVSLVGKCSCGAVRSRVEDAVVYASGYRCSTSRARVRRISQLSFQLSPPS
jgi:hypothetical protein